MTQGAVLGAFPLVREAIATAMEEIIVGSRSPAEALDDAAEEAAETMQNYTQRLR